MSYSYGLAASTRQTVQPSGRNRSRLVAYLRTLDWVLLGAALILSSVGALLVWSATRSRMIGFGNDPQTYFKRHLLNMVIGIVFAVIASRTFYRLLRAYTPILYLISVLGLVLVLVPQVGASVNGAKAWIPLPAGFSIQPSEFAKIGIILAMAMILAEKRDSEVEPKNVNVTQALLIAGIPMGLVMLQPDLGTVLVTAGAVLGIVAVSGAKARWLIGIAAAAVVVTMVAFHFNLVKPYQVQRIGAFIDAGSNASTTGYNTVQARIAIGSGGLAGQGLFQGSQTQGRFVPYNQTDFVYSVAGEELGMLGAGGIVLLLGVIMWRGIRIALRSTDLFGRLVCVGIVCWLTFQAFENIGMNLGISPVTGVPLPFVSYGGTSMFASWIAIGLLLNVNRKNNSEAGSASSAGRTKIIPA